MRFMYACQTDKGTARSGNQDSLIVKSVTCGQGPALLAAVCDGVGGLSRGEVASRRAAELLGEWAEYELPRLLETETKSIRFRFRQQLREINREIFLDSRRNGISSGTTLTALVMWNYRFLLGHVGDSRAYAVTQTVRRLTEDDSWVAWEMAAGRMTAEEAKNHSRKNVILRCIGADEELEPRLAEGRIGESTVFLLCTDGFWHHIEDAELLRYFSPERADSQRQLGNALYYLFDQVKRRGENDNITAIAVKVF